jgi:hypothetical protein
MLDIDLSNSLWLIIDQFACCFNTFYFDSFALLTLESLLGRHLIQIAFNRLVVSFVSHLQNLGHKVRELRILFRIAALYGGPLEQSHVLRVGKDVVGCNSLDLLLSASKCAHLLEGTIAKCFNVQFVRIVHFLSKPLPAVTALYTLPVVAKLLVNFLRLLR